MCPKPYYPFGKDGNVNCKGCAPYYPLDGDDLTFEGNHPLLGIVACSNVFSGGRFSLRKLIQMCNLLAYILFL